MRKILVSLFIGLLLGMVLGVLAHRQWLEWFPLGSPFAKAAPPPTQTAPPATQPPPATTPPVPASTPAPPSTPPASTPPPPTQTAPPAPAPGDQFADVPTWIPVYPGSKLTTRGYSSGVVLYSFTTDVKATEVLSFYDGQLRNAGWTSEASKPGFPTRWEKGDQTISVSVAESMSGPVRITMIQLITAAGAGK